MKINYKLVPTQINHRNSSERSIRTWVNNLKSGLESTDIQLPASEWYRCIPLAVITLDILRN